MEIEEVYRRDLNLLVALRVLIEEGSVSRAATRLNLSQSAMSRVLARLRVLLDDPLFTRNGHRLMPTEKAQQINRQLSAPLEALKQVLSPQDFDITQYQDTFTVATTDYAMQTIMPFSLSQIQRNAPQASFEFVPLDQERLADQLNLEQVDLAIGRVPSLPAPLRHQVLGKVGVSCLVSRSHPCAQKELSLDDYLSYPHAIIAISEGVNGMLNEALAAYKKRNVVLKAYYLQAAVALFDNLPLIVTVPADLAYLLAQDYDLVVKPLPFHFAPFDYSMIWHARRDHSPAQVWLRESIEKEWGRLMARRQQLGLNETHFSK